MNVSRSTTLVDVSASSCAQVVPARRAEAYKTGVIAALNRMMDDQHRNSQKSICNRWRRGRSQKKEWRGENPGAQSILAANIFSVVAENQSKVSFTRRTPLGEFKCHQRLEAPATN